MSTSDRRGLGLLGGPPNGGRSAGDVELRAPSLSAQLLVVRNLIRRPELNAHIQTVRQVRNRTCDMQVQVGFPIISAN